MNKKTHLSAVTPRDEARLRIDFEAFLYDLLYIHPSVVIKMARDAVDRERLDVNALERFRHYLQENFFLVGSAERTIFHLAYLNRRKELRHGAGGEVSA